MKNNYKYIFTAKLPLRFGDLDLNGHVNNAKFFEYFEEASTQWLLEMGEKFGFDITDAMSVYSDCHFISELQYPATIEVKLHIAEVNDNGFKIYYQVLCNNTLSAEGSTKIVWTDRSTGETLEMPEVLRNYMNGI